MASYMGPAAGVRGAQMRNLPAAFYFLSNEDDQMETEIYNKPNKTPGLSITPPPPPPKKKLEKSPQQKEIPLVIKKGMQ